MRRVPPSRLHEQAQRRRITHPRTQQSAQATQPPQRLCHAIAPTRLDTPAPIPRPTPAPHLAPPSVACSRCYRYGRNPGKEVQFEVDVTAAWRWRRPRSPEPWWRLRESGPGACAGLPGRARMGRQGCVQKSTRIHTHTHTHTHADTQTRTHARTHAHTPRMHARTHPRTHARTRAHTCRLKALLASHSRWGGAARHRGQSCHGMEGVVGSEETLASLHRCHYGVCVRGDRRES